MNNPKSLTIDQLFAEALSQAGPDLSKGGLRLLTSGFTALREEQEKTLNKIELRAITSMITYTAHTQGVIETTIMSVLAAQFGAEDVRLILSRRYQEAINFLVDLKMAKVIN